MMAQLIGTEDSDTVTVVPSLEQNMLTRMESTYLANADSAEEALHFFQGVGNVLGRVFNNIKTFVTKHDKALKRGELKAFIDSHSVTLKIVFAGGRTEEVNTTKVPLPEGMIGTYNETAQALVSVLEEATALQALTEIEKIVTKMAASDVSGLGAFTKPLTDVLGVMKAPHPDKVSEAFKGVMTAKRAPLAVTGKKAFGSEGDLVKAKDAILTFEKYYNDAIAAGRLVQKVEKAINTCLDKLDDAETVDSKFLGAFYTAVQSLAVQVDTYGAVMEIAQRVEHNYVLALRAILKKM
jgi:hypothetical protein